MTNDSLTAVGLGPGDPELLTLKGLRAIQAAQLIFVPRSRGRGQSLALQVASPHIDPARQAVIELPLPMTRDAEVLESAWQAAAETIAAAFQELRVQGVVDRRGVYLLLGDPLLYGTFPYIQAALQRLCPAMAVEIVPGVTSFAAAAARIQQPLSAMAGRVAILPASHETDAAALREILAAFESVVLLKVGPVLPQMVQLLEALGRLTDAVYVERVGMPDERVVLDLRQLPPQPTSYFSLILVTRKQ